MSLAITKVASTGTDNKNGRKKILNSGDKWRTKPLVYRLNDRDGPEIISQVLEERNWVAYDEMDNGDDWNLWWSPVRQQKLLSQSLKPWQFVNEIQALTSGRVSRKDYLVRYIRSARAVYGDVYNFLPLTFVLPSDYVRFILEYSNRKDHLENYWILKPADKSRGRGIFIFKLLNELTYSNSAVVQKYITNPLLVSGYKFDLRIYVCVTCLDPLTIYAYHDGLVRFATVPFNLKFVRNQFAHMTNTSINKFSPAYDEGKGLVGLGCKWTIQQLRRHFSNFGICDWPLWQSIGHILILTILCDVRAIISNNNYDGTEVGNCFELYGFDVLVDDELNPWLLEVNRRPSLCLDCEVDQLVKKPLLHDLIDLIGIEEAVPYSAKVTNGSRGVDSSWKSRWHHPPDQIGGFQRLFPFTSSNFQTQSKLLKSDSTIKAPRVNVRYIINKVRQLQQYIEVTRRVANERNSKWPLEDWEFEEIMASLMSGKEKFRSWIPRR